MVMIMAMFMVVDCIFRVKNNDCFTTILIPIFTSFKLNKPVLNIFLYFLFRIKLPNAYIHNQSSNVLFGVHFHYSKLDYFDILLMISCTFISQQ